MKTSSALTTVFVTSVRKAITIVLSFLIFAKPFTIWYLLGGFMVFAGLFTNMFATQKGKSSKVASSEDKAKLDAEWTDSQKVHNV
jgi:drug/metabolite transporter (DMT)-like permease